MFTFLKAPSILGLRPTGVERLADVLLEEGLAAPYPSARYMEVEPFNHLYAADRDEDGMINAPALRDFSVRLKNALLQVLRNHSFPVVLGGDCSILIGSMLALKTTGKYGLVTFDGHADFYLPSQSPTGEAADMDIALVTGRGPDALTDIEGRGPYVPDERVIHVGQRDEDETMQYGSMQLSQTSIRRYGLEKILGLGAEKTASHIKADMRQAAADGFWVHLDTDVIHDDENPAVDYRLPGGLRIASCERIVGELLESGMVTGLSVSIYNPKLDPGRQVGKRLARLIRDVLSKLAV